MTGDRALATGPRRPVGFWVALGLCLIWAVGSELIGAALGWGTNRVLDFICGLAFLWAGLFALWRRRGNVIGALLLAYGIIWFANYCPRWARPSWTHWCTSSRG